MTDLQKLKEIGSIKTFNVNDYIFRQGEPGDEMYIILSGRVGIYLNGAGDSAVNVSYLESGDSFGEMSLLEEVPRNVSALAETAVTVITISQKNFQVFICDSYSIPYKIMMGLSNQLNQLYTELSNYKGRAHASVRPSDNTEPEKTVDSEKQVEEAREDNKTGETTISGNPDIKGFGTLFPAGHKKYNLTAPAVYNDFLITSQAKCPVCEQNFAGKKQYLSKLKFEKMDHDFRKHYTDFEPVWYLLWVCPHCYYTNYYLEFDAIPAYKKQTLLTKTTELKKELSLEFSEPRTVDQVFIAYYLGIFCANFYNASPLKFARLWLQLSWLYHDVNDEEMFKTASEAALESYYSALYKTTDMNLSIEQMQQCLILLGELYLLRGDEKEAMRHFYTAIKKDGGRESFNQQAENRIHDLRREKMAF